MTSALRDQFRSMLIEQVAPSFRADVPLAQQRLVLEGMGAQSVLPEGIVVERSELAGLTTELISMPEASKEHALLYLHGGGYVMGSCASHRGLAAWIAAAAGVQVVLPEYRLAPEHPAPAALDDAVAAYRALLARGIAAERIVIIGDSAGGGLTLATLLALRDAGEPLPRAAVMISPWTDMTFSGESIQTRAAVDPWLAPSLLEPFLKLFRGKMAPSDPRISPLFGDFKGLPPMLVQVGDQEILLSDSERMVERAKAAGVRIELEIAPELWHVYQLFAPALPDANEAIARIGKFVQAELAR